MKWHYYNIQKAAWPDWGIYNAQGMHCPSGVSFYIAQFCCFLHVKHELREYEQDA